MGTESKPNIDFATAEAAGEAAFLRIEPQLSDHYRYGKSRPNEPKCPYRMEKRQALRVGYSSAKDEFVTWLQQE